LDSAHWRQGTIDGALWLTGDMIFLLLSLMTNQQLFVGLILVGIGLVVNGWIQYLMWRSRKTKEHEVIHESLAEVTSKTESIKVALAALSDPEHQLQREERSALFAMSDAFAVWFAAIENFDYKQSDQLDASIERLESVSRDFVAAQSRFSLLAYNDVEMVEAVDDLIKVTSAYHRLMIAKGRAYKNLELTEIPEFVYKVGFRRKESAEMVKEQWNNVNVKLRKRLGLEEASSQLRT
jgi:hypothetical protein